MSEAVGVVGVVMPKWGLSMTEGEIVEWLVAEGDTVIVGDELAEVETDKITGEVEATDAGVVRRIVAEAGSRHRVKALLVVLADPAVDDATIDQFIVDFPEPPEVEESDAAASAYETMAVGDLQIRYSVLGEGPAVILLHGFGGDLDNWLFTMGPLAEHHTVVAIDLPGHGQSSLAIPDPSADGLARVAWAVLDGLEINDVDVVGHSMGGAVAARMAAQQPDRVRSVTGLAPAGLGPEINQDYIDGYVAAQSRREMKPVAAVLFADPSAVTRAMVEDLLRYKRLDGVPALLGGLSDVWFVDGAQAEQAQVADELAALTKPTLIIWGAQDRVIPASHAESVKAFAEVHVLDGAGHLVQMEQAGEVNRLLVAHVGSGAATTP